MLPEPRARLDAGRKHIIIFSQRLSLKLQNSSPLSLPAADDDNERSVGAEKYITTRGVPTGFREILLCPIGSLLRPYLC